MIDQNEQNEPKSNLHKPEVRIGSSNSKTTRKRTRAKLTPPVDICDLEDATSYHLMLDRHFDELPPSNVQQEGDLVALAQLRWSCERLHNLLERELNHRVRMPHLQNTSDAGARLMLGYRLCLGDSTFLLLGKQHLDILKTINPLSARVEKWSALKPRRKEQ